MEVNYKRTILFTILWTLLALFLATISLWLIMFLGFPRTLGDFCYSIGMDNMSANLYFKDYERSGDIRSLYKSLNIEIKSKDYDKVIKYYDAFLLDDEYDKFTESYNDYNRSLNISVLEKSVLLNEENYLANHYITALVNSNQTDKAFNLALTYFSNYEEFTLEEQGVYAFNLFIDNQQFDRVPSGYSISILNSMQDYFDKSIDIFNQNENTDSDLEKAYLLSLGNRIIEAGKDMKKLYSDRNNTSQIDINTEKMMQINEKIKGLL